MGDLSRASATSPREDLMKICKLARIRRGDLRFSETKGAFKEPTQIRGMFYTNAILGLL